MKFAKMVTLLIAFGMGHCFAASTETGKDDKGAAAAQNTAAAKNAAAPDAGKKNEGKAEKSKGLGKFVQQKLSEGLRGKDLDDAIHQEQERLGIKDDNSIKTKVQSLEQKQDKIAKIDKKIGDIQERLNKAGDAKKKEKLQQDINELNTKKEKIQKDITETAESF